MKTERKRGRGKMTDKGKGGRKVKYIRNGRRVKERKEEGRKNGRKYGRRRKEK